MAQPSLSELTAAAAAATQPVLVPANTPKLGGVDPLGLRQINFDLMDQVIPGLNNVARHIRPFVVVTWAWRRAHQLAGSLRVSKVPVNDLRDFVDRIEVIYAWSQFLRDNDADLPGKQVLAAIVQSDQWTFGGKAWGKFRKDRRYSTAFTAPITYGPSLKTLGWLSPHLDDPGVLIPNPSSGPALDAFEARIRRQLGHPAFSQLGTVTVLKEEVERWSSNWALDQPTQKEKDVMAEMLLGFGAPLARRKGCALMLGAVSHIGVSELATVRTTMAGPPSNFVPPADLYSAFEAWRRVQVRQLFRLSLEGLLYWAICLLEDGPKSTATLVSAFLTEVGRPQHGTASEWLNAAGVQAFGPTALMDEIELALDDPAQATLALALANGLSFCIAEAPAYAELFERVDRLPLARARREAEAWKSTPATSFMRHVLESWVLAQHVYWSVGRGLADARARGKRLLRLKIVLEEGGWTLAPGASRGSPPSPHRR